MLDGGGDVGETRVGGIGQFRVGGKGLGGGIFQGFFQILHPTVEPINLEAEIFERLPPFLKVST